MQHVERCAPWQGAWLPLLRVSWLAAHSGSVSVCCLVRIFLLSHRDHFALTLPCLVRSCSAAEKRITHHHLTIQRPKLWQHHVLPKQGRSEMDKIIGYWGYPGSLKTELGIWLQELPCGVTNHGGSNTTTSVRQNDKSSDAGHPSFINFLGVSHRILKCNSSTYPTFASIAMLWLMWPVSQLYAP